VVRYGVDRAKVEGPLLAIKSGAAALARQSLCRILSFNLCSSSSVELRTLLDSFIFAIFFKILLVTLFIMLPYLCLSHPGLFALTHSSSASKFSELDVSIHQYVQSYAKVCPPLNL